MGGHRREASIDGAGLAAAWHTIHRRFHIVVDAPARHAAETRQAAGVGIEEHLVALAGISHHPKGAGCAELHVGELDLAIQAANQNTFVAPVELEGLACDKGEGHEGGARGGGIDFGTAAT